MSAVRFTPKTAEHAERTVSEDEGPAHGMREVKLVSLAPRSISMRLVKLMEQWLSEQTVPSSL